MVRGTLIAAYSSDPGVGRQRAGSINMVMERSWEPCNFATSCGESGADGIQPGG